MHFRTCWTCFQMCLIVFSDVLEIIGMFLICFQTPDISDMANVSDVPDMFSNMFSCILDTFSDTLSVNLSSIFWDIFSDTLDMFLDMLDAFSDVLGVPDVPDIFPDMLSSILDVFFDMLNTPDMAFDVVDLSLPASILS
jgi:hypothetical protein